MKNWFFIFLSAASLNSCTYETPKEKDDILLAEVYNRKLYLSDLNGLEFDDRSEKDSIMFVQFYVEKWVQESLILHEAEKNLNDTRQIDKLVKNYRSGLLIHEYEKEVCKTELDTSISKAELISFYEKNKQLYQLKSPILRCSFMKIPLIASDLVQMEKLWQNDDAESKLMLADYCNKYAEKYNLTEDKWYRLSDLKRILPNNSLNNIQNIKNFRSQDNTYIYLFKLLDWVSNNSTAPLDFVEKKASKIILKNRRRVLLENKRQKLFETAKYSDNVKVFTK